MSVNKQQQAALKFVATMFILFIIFHQGNIFMNSVLSPGSKYYNSFFDNTFDYIHMLRMALIKPAVWIIKLFGFYAIHNETDVLVMQGPYLRVNYSCLGLGVMSFLTAFIIAFPAARRSKIKAWLLGILIIYTLNVLRIAGLGILMRSFASQRKYFDYHHEIFNILVYLAIILFLFIWMRKHGQVNGEKPLNAQQNNPS